MRIRTVEIISTHYKLTLQSRIIVDFVITKSNITAEFLNENGQAGLNQGKETVEKDGI